MPVSEAQAIEALPSHGFIRDYVCYAYQQTTAPVVFHELSACACLAPSCPIDYGIHYAGKMLRANVFVLAIGMSGDDQKSSAMDIGPDLLCEAAPIAIAHMPASWEALVESLSKRPRQLLHFSEFGQFLKASAGKGYFSSIKPVLAALADCTPQIREKTDKKDKESGEVKTDMVVARQPRLTVSAASSLRYLEQYSEPADWDGGFFGRFIVGFGRRERTDPWPRGNPEPRPALLDVLADRMVAGQKAYAPCWGMTDQAMQLWYDWFWSLQPRKIPEVIGGLRTRTPTMAIKVAMLMAWDHQIADEQTPWYLGLDQLIPAIQLAELHLQSVVELADYMALHPEAMSRQMVFNSIPDTGAIVTLGDILHSTKLQKRTVITTIDGLLAEGVISSQFDPAGGGQIYRRGAFET